MPTYEALHEALRAAGYRRRGMVWRRGDRLLRVRSRRGDDRTGDEFALRYEPSSHPVSPEDDLWFLFSTVERRALLAHQREVIERYRSRSEQLGDLRLANNTDDYLNVSMWYLYFSEDEREDWARRLVGPTLRALGKLDG